MSEPKTKGVLYLVATPIGNLQDITFRAISVLQEADWILAEDTRVTGKLLAKYEISTKMISYHKFNLKRQNKTVLSFLESGNKIALVSDAGTPIVSDPGYELVNLAIDLGCDVVPIPGACAFLSAYMASGFGNEGFYFVGFCTKLDKKLLEIDVPLIFYEAPHRIISFLKKLLDFFGDRKVVIARELTKLHETFYRGNLADFVGNSDGLMIKGEFVVIIDGCKDEASYDDAFILRELQKEIDKGLSHKEAIKQICLNFELKKKPSLFT